MKQLDLNKLAGGSMSVQVHRAIDNVMRNIQDPNTEATAGRKINIQITFKANENRSVVDAKIVTKTTLAPEVAAATTMAVGKDLKTGEVMAEEIGNQIPGQITIAAEEPQEAQEQDFDPETGEIMEDTEEPVNSKITVLGRKAQ